MSVYLGIEYWRLPQCIVPSDRPLWEVLVDAVQHGEYYPSHGANCSCMDELIWELRRHIDRALPEVERFVEEDPGSQEPTIHYRADQWAANMAARRRIVVILGALGRDL